MENRPVIRVQRASEFSRYRPFCCYGIMRILRLNDRMFFPFDQLKARLTAHLSVFFTRKRSLGAANTQIFQADVFHTNLWIDLSGTDETSMTPSHLRALTSKTRGWFHFVSLKCLSDFNISLTPRMLAGGSTMFWPLLTHHPKKSLHHLSSSQALINNNKP